MRKHGCSRSIVVGQQKVSTTETPAPRRRLRTVGDVQAAVTFCLTCRDRVRIMRPEVHLRVLLGAVAFCGDCRAAVVRWIRLDNYRLDRERKRRRRGVPLDAPVAPYRCGLCGEVGHNARRCLMELRS